MQIAQESIIDNIDIKSVVKDAKLGWLKEFFLLKIWPLIKDKLEQKLKEIIVDLIEKIVNKKTS